ncbi:MAG: long-chain-fatty-acid--CoA ligase [Acidaminococcus sp.]|jgi:long-chain acyl-CoA synthetase|nr:long-chain-fatty-acid--CoA ligase [Acidaminococcus sp.]MCI2100505.1 long-chain-fatty-acid--CoA ligase [Acidaminococcus sp.]MCI2114834.1 long-chain-fatty-acid--CoA ligase [Acidaminococcus sp.]MCI2116879.1 long-chain-fatty-acid--CoA ligase [Acidaminococcus sp.]
MLFFDIYANHPDEAEAIIDQDRHVTYGELRRLVDQWAGVFQKKGVQPGDRVGLFSKNCIDFILTYFAVVRAGGVVVPINFQLVPREVAYIVHDAGIKLLVVKKPMALEDPLKEMGGPECEQVTFAELEQAPAETLKEVPMQPDDNCSIIYTSGTTGSPKGAMLSHTDLCANARDFTMAVPYNEKDTVLCLLPMYHCFAWTVCVASTLLHGGRIVIQSVYNFKTAMRLVRKHKVTVFTGVPAVFRLLCESRDLESVESVRFFISGAAPLGLDLGRTFAVKYGRPVFEGYGLSEASPVVTFNYPGKIKIGSIGVPIPNVQVKIVSPDGKEMERCERGEVLVKGPNVMLGYLNRPEETKSTIVDGWLHTGDVGYIDEDGFVFLVDRIKDLIISSGENVYPREIEEAACKFEGIAEAAVIGVPDKLRGESICIYVVPQEGIKPNLKALRQYLLGQVAPYKVPREYFLVSELPRTGLGKVRKPELRKKAIAVLSENRLAGRVL